MKNMKKFLFAAVAFVAMSMDSADAQTSQTSDMSLGTIYVNGQITTHLVMPETIRLVDISTDTIVGNQVNDNIVRLKPKGAMQDYEQAGIVTVIGERHIAQYKLVYRTCMTGVCTRFTVPYWDMQEYQNPDVQMSVGEMSRYAIRIFNAKRSVTGIHSKKDKMKAWVNHICSAGDYFFIDFSLENKTKIPYDISEIRVKLEDKKQKKATNYQSVELTPEFMLNCNKHFKKRYRNVLVVKKLTFPEAKVLKIEVSENQISGRTIELNINYDDVLGADCFDE
jgi:conjugative transposon TraN protein